MMDEELGNKKLKKIEDDVINVLFTLGNGTLNWTRQDRVEKELPQYTPEEIDREIIRLILAKPSKAWRQYRKNGTVAYVKLTNAAFDP